MDINYTEVCFYAVRTNGSLATKSLEHPEANCWKLVKSFLRLSRAALRKSSPSEAPFCWEHGEGHGKGTGMATRLTWVSILATSYSGCEKLSKLHSFSELISHKLPKKWE